MKRRFVLIGVVVTSTLLPLCGIAAPLGPNPPGCEQWFARVKVNERVAMASPYQLSSNDKAFPYQLPSDDKVLEAIDCMLLLRGDKHPARISGATHLEVSQILPDATVELAALYYISYLFTGDWQHGDGVALWNQHGVINPEGAIDVAFSVYIVWLKRVRSMGLLAARMRNLDPLEGTHLAWYGRWRPEMNSNQGENPVNPTTGREGKLP